MIMRILVGLGLLVLGGGFVFFAANVIWLGTKEFFKIYGPKKQQTEQQAKQQINKESKNNEC